MRHPTTLVLLPGLDGTDVFFRPLIARLPSWVSPIVVEYPTTGRNDYQSLLEVVSGAVRNAGDCWVLGWSFSGPLALMLAVGEPHRVRGVILCASFVRPPRPIYAPCRFLATDAAIWVLRVARRIPLLVSTNGREHLRRDKLETWRRVPAGTLAARVRAVLGVDARRLLRRCTAPIFYLAGARDSVVPHSNAEEIARHAPSVRVITIDGHHMAIYTNPQAAADAIASLLACPEDAHGGLAKEITMRVRDECPQEHPHARG